MAASHHGLTVRIMHTSEIAVYLDKTNSLMAKCRVPTIYDENREHSGINGGINRDFQQLSHISLTQAENKGAVGQARERKGLILSTHLRAEMQENQIRAGFSIVAVTTQGFSLYFYFKNCAK